jgi:hypothetical protein
MYTNTKQGENYLFAEAYYDIQIRLINIFIIMTGNRVMTNGIEELIQVMHNTNIHE